MGTGEKTTKNKKTASQILSWIVTGISILLLVIAAFFLIVTLVAKKNDSRAVSIFGYSFSIVQTDSMTGEIEVGELITVKLCGIDKAEIGSNVVYTASSGPLKGQQIVHQVIEISSDKEDYHIITQGVKEGAPVDDPVYADQFVGIVVRHSLFWGKIAKFFATPFNWILIVVLIVGLPCIYTLIKLVIKYSKEVKKEREEKTNDRKE